MRNTGCNGLCITGEHNGFGDTGLSKVTDGFCCIWLDLIRNYDVTQVFASGADMHDGTYFHIGVIIFLCDRDPQIPHQLQISGADAEAVHFRDEPFSADFLRVTDTGSRKILVPGIRDSLSAFFQTFVPGLFKAAADRVRGIALCKGRIFQKPVGCFRSFAGLSRCGFLIPSVFTRSIKSFCSNSAVHCRADSGDHEITFRECTGLVKDHGPYIGQGLHEVGALDQDALTAGSSDSAEKCERNADNDRAGTADDQECQCSIDPVGPESPVPRDMEDQHVDQRSQNGQCESAVADRRRVPAGKF